MSKYDCFCARCGTDITRNLTCGSIYSSDIDRKHICYHCWEKEQPEYLMRKIADLEAKLAESEEQLNNSEQKCLICNKYQENAQLKQQLAEKEKEIETMKHFKVTIGTMENNQVDISSTTYINQDKIELLERVKKEIVYPQLCFDYSLYLRVTSSIDTLIKEIKGE